MRTTETVSELAHFEQRGAGTDAERRAARWLCSELKSGGRDAQLESFWCRPNWALAHAWHVVLGLAGSLLSVSSPRIGGALLVVALLSVIADAVVGWSPGRRLTPERASQNVVSVAGHEAPRVHLIITANYDAGRVGLVYRSRVRAVIARLKRITGETLTVGWMAWLVIVLSWLLLVAILRLGGAHGAPIGIVQLVPTVVLVLALSLLVELASSDYGPAAGDNASGVSVALALVRALDVAPPRRLAVELVLQGAGDGGGIGLRRHFRGRKRTLRATNVVVLGIGPCGSGRPRWWISDGALVPLRYLGRLRELSARVAASEAHLEAGPHRGRGATPALPARAAGLPAATIGCLDERGLVAHSHLSDDTPEHVDPAAMDSTLELALALVDAIDAELGHTALKPAATPA